jgi:hypothetical protein
LQETAGTGDNRQAVGNRGQVAGDEDTLHYLWPGRLVLVVIAFFLSRPTGLAHPVTRSHPPPPPPNCETH